MSETKIEYNAEYLKLIKGLTDISPGIIFAKEDGKIVVNRTNKGRTIFFKVTAPESYLSFEGEKIAFYQFADFYQIMGAFGTASLTQNKNKIIIEHNATYKTNFMLSSPEVLSKSPSKANLPEPDMVFNLSAEALADIKKMNNLISGKYLKISNVEKAITLQLYNSNHDNSFDMQFVPETFVDDLENFDFPIFSEVIAKLPVGMNYKVALFKKGYTSFSFTNDPIEFIAVTGRAKTDSSKDNTPED